MNKSEKYLEKTLLQAKRMGLQSDYIKKLETERNERLEKEKTIQTEVHQNTLHN